MMKNATELEYGKPVVVSEFLLEVYAGSNVITGAADPLLGLVDVVEMDPLSR